MIPRSVLRRVAPRAVAVALAAAAVGSVAADPSALRRDGSLVVRLSEADLNGALAGAIEAAGGPTLEGREERPSRYVSDLTYRVTLADPTIAVEGDGRLSLRLAVPEAELRVGRVERRLAGSRVRCEGLDLRLDKALELSLDVRLAADAAGLRLVPVAADIGALGEAFRMERPERCRHAFLPSWLLWWVGKPRLRHKLDDLGRRWIGEFEESASRVEPFAGTWTVGGLPLALHPADIAAAGDALEVAFDVAGPSAPADSGPRPPGPAVDAGSWIAISEPLLEDVLALELADAGSAPRPPSGSLRSVFGSRAALALVPGLASLDSRDDLRIGVSVADRPRLELVAAESGPRIVVHVSGAAIDLFDGAEPIGSLRIDRGTIELVPKVSPLGGVWFDLANNDWSVSSDGVEADRALLAATIQELVFGEAFRTRYEPFGRDVARLGSFRLGVRELRVADGWLVAVLGSAPPLTPVAAATDLHANR